MTPEEYNALTQELARGEADEARVSEILCDITEAYEDISSQLANANNEISTLKDNNTSLKQANYELFLRVGKRTEKIDEEPKDPEIKTPSDYIKDIGEYR